MLLYRGQTVKDNKWIEGFVIADDIENPKHYYILKAASEQCSNDNEVSKESIGCSLELTMHNDNEDIVFEKDAIELNDKIFVIKYVESICSYLGVCVTSDTGFDFYLPPTQLLDGKYLGPYKLERNDEDEQRNNID